jgi:hypothetical protein
MQPHDSNDQRATEGTADGRRDTERSTDDSATGLAPAAVPDAADGTVCLSARLVGSGKAAG